MSCMERRGTSVMSCTICAALFLEATKIISSCSPRYCGRPRWEPVPTGRRSHTSRNTEGIDRTNPTASPALLLHSDQHDYAHGVVDVRSCATPRTRHLLPSSWGRR
jgi:hypothetical protein